MNTPAFNPEHESIREALRTGAPERVVRLISKAHPADIALLFKDLEPGEVRLLFDILFSVRRAEKVLKELPQDLLPDILALIDDEKIARVISRADPDDAVTFAAALPEERRERVLAMTDPERRRSVRLLTGYPEGTVGRIMTTDVFALPPETTAQQAIDKIRERGELDTFFYLYVVDRQRRLVGVVPIRNLVIAPPDRTLGEIMIPDPLRTEATMDQEEAARLVAKHDLLALPVVDEQGLLLGMITIDDVLDIIERESTEDMYKMAGLTEADRIFTPPLRSIKLRLPWTLINLATASFAASVVTIFEATLASLVVLAAFMPIIAGVGGNAGIQTMTVMVRSIALGELAFSSAWRAVAKEVSVNFCLALVAGGLAALLVVFLWDENPMLGLVVAGAMIVNTGLVAGLAGALIPLALKRFGYDPALGSGIIITALIDAFGFLSFLGLATLFLDYLI
jgi:magnesium transporter